MFARADGEFCSCLQYIMRNAVYLIEWELLIVDKMGVSELNTPRPTQQ
ncbi:MAG: hypothetical protein K0R15_1855 [Clostridiales bacterium]|jgi:hypothetical protein|nr:hypothetical protein [Clostridiales bacterium]